MALRRTLLWMLWIGMLLLPILLLILPEQFFDHGPALCLSRVLFDQECPGCGMTRACMRLAHGNWADAALFNRLAYIVFPLLCILYLAEWTKLSARLGLPVPGHVVRLIRRLRL